MRYLLIGLLLTAAPAFAQNGSKLINLEDVWRNGTFRIKSVPGFNAMQDGLHYTQTDNTAGGQEINVYNLQTGQKESTLLTAEAARWHGRPVTLDEYAFSADEQKLLLLAEPQNIYRRSVLHRVYVYDRQKKSVDILDADKVLHPTFSPDGTKVAYVKNNNLYYKDLASGDVVAVTTDGEKNRIINGNCDWVYEEEFEFTRAYEWSGNGKYLAYYRFDESAVPQYTMTVYDSLYPTPYQYKYPKAGERNSSVQIRCFELATGRMRPSDIGAETDLYIPRIKWTKNPGQLCIYRLNRLQNKLELLLADAATGRTEVAYSESNRYFVEINDNLQFLPDGQSFIFNSEQDGWNHLYIWNWNKKKLTALTAGNFEIEELTAVDDAKKLVYYTAAVESPMQRKLYAVDFSGKSRKTLTPEDGTHAITPIEGNKFFLDKHSTLTQPPVFYLRDAKGTIIRTLEDNAELKQKMQEYALGKIRFTQVPGAGDTKLNAWMITPPDFSETKKYPVLMFQYSGPNSQQVADKFPVADYFWNQMLAQKGYIILCVDPTGTAFRGEEFRKKTYLQMGKYESEDLIAAARSLSSLPYVDRDRIGIWGWSYGGFMSSTCIFKGADVFRMAVSVAPVTNWRYYDNIYTERYMRTPQENPKGYDENAPELMTDKLKGKFLLIHGTGDDNVHVQNSMMMVNNLIRNNKEFDSEYYPNRAHGISGGNTRLHLYRRMTDFILKNL